MNAPDRVLRPSAILRALAERNVEFIVVGGIAVQAHGYIRATADLDLVPRPTLVNLSRLGETLVELEAAPRRATATINVTDPQLLKRVPMVPLITRYGRLDLLNIEHLAGAPGTYDDLDARALAIVLDEIEIRVAGLDDLVRMKRAAGRQLVRIARA